MHTLVQRSPICMNIARLEFDPVLICFWNQVIIKVKRTRSQYRGTYKIRPHQSTKAYTSAENSNNLGSTGQLSGKKYNSQKSQERTKKITVKKHEILVVIPKNAFQWRFIFN